MKKERGGLPVWEREKRTLTNGLVTSVRNLESSYLEITAIVIHGPSHRGDCPVKAVLSIVEIMSYHVTFAQTVDDYL